MEYFATLVKILHLKKIARKCSIFLHQLYFFLMGRSRTFFFGIRIKFHLGRAKGRSKMGYGERGLFVQNSHYSARYKLNLTNVWSEKLLITSIVISMPKTYMQGFSSDFEQFFLVKKLFVYFYGTNRASK